MNQRGRKSRETREERREFSMDCKLREVHRRSARHREQRKGIKI
ncbi:hypothetical protein COLO4_26899 [Corchorus olitorius]|uniref:Uncharacterized protein n=1 Tax=Corchorus olitorius TaxID=93759 RepID=A0A1R3HTY8_9ROSI|nr:hypothetical protein COLO4_26899 [Corchorus olitorius]